MSDFPRDLGGGLVLRRATATDAAEVADFNSVMQMELDATEPDTGIGLWTRELMEGAHPTMRASDVLVVEDTNTHRIVSTSNLISQVWSYGGVPFKLGRPELVATHPNYRNRGLVRAQFDVLHQWSAERGELAQAITGIPFYYRQFGYEMTVAMGGARAGYKVHIPKLKEGTPEPANIRPATEADIPFIAGLYNAAARRYLLTVVRDEAMWRYELSGRHDRSVARQVLRIIETPEGELRGFFSHAPVLWGPTLAVGTFELAPGVSWSAVVPSVLRYLGKTGEEYAARDKKAEFGAFAFRLGESHPVYDMIPSWLPRKPSPYAFFMRVPDLAAFAKQIAPVLEGRLANSPLSGYTGEVKLNFYRSTLRLVFDKGALTAAEPYIPVHQEDGSAFFPNLTFLHILFGHLDLDELQRVYPDAFTRTDEARALVRTLFPQCDSFLVVIG